MAKKKASKTESLKKQLLEVAPTGPPPAKDFLSSGSTLLDKACSDRPFGAYPKGHMIHYVGDSNAGKTWFVLAAFAEACLNKNFADYRLVYDPPEGGAIMNIGRYFGKELERRIESPYKDGRSSQTVQEFYRNVEKLQDERKPFLYAIDSENALRAEEADDREQAEKEGKEGGGSYNTEKAKYHSNHLNKLVSRLKETGSILFLISQSRANIGFGAKFNPKVYSGGLSLKFYAALQIWVAIRGQEIVTFRGKKRQQGILAQLHIRKNRITGRDRTVEVPIYHSFGIDDVGSCVDYLIDENHWDKKDGIITASDLDVKLSRDALIRKIEEEGLQKQVRLTVSEVWDEIEEAVRIDRKSRYV